VICEDGCDGSGHGVRSSQMLALMYQCGSGADRKMPQNDETCAVKLRGGVEGGDGALLRARSCGALVFDVKFICSRIKKVKAEGRRCHAKTIMNTIADKAQT